MLTDFNYLNITEVPKVKTNTFFFPFQLSSLSP